MGQIVAEASIDTPQEYMLEMYNEYSKKIIVNGETVKYTGSMESDVFKGSYGNKVKGIVNLRIFGMKITKDATRLLKK